MYMPPSILPPSGSPRVVSRLVFRKGKSFGSSARHCHIFLAAMEKMGKQAEKGREQEEEEEMALSPSLSAHTQTETRGVMNRPQHLGEGLVNSIFVTLAGSGIIYPSKDTKPHSNTSKLSDEVMFLLPSPLRRAAVVYPSSFSLSFLIRRP